MIYAIWAKGTPFVKFGVTSEVNIRDRLNTLQIGCPFELEVLACGMGGEAEEKDIHFRLEVAGQWHRGERFKLSEEVEAAIEWIKDRKKPLPQMPDLKPGRSRLGRALEYAEMNQPETYKGRKAAKAKSLSDLQASPQNNSSPSSTQQSNATEMAHLFTLSLLTWESNTLLSIANSSNTERANGETLKSPEPSLN